MFLKHSITYICCLIFVAFSLKVANGAPSRNGDNHVTSTAIVPLLLLSTSCGTVPEGQSEMRVRYLAPSVPYSQSCQSEVQTRTCNGDSLSDFSPNNYQYDSCSVLDPEPNSVHDFTGLPLDSNGFTDISAIILQSGQYVNSRIIYASSSQGNDSTARVYNKESFAATGGPLSPPSNVSAYRTIEAAKEQLRDGFADVLLLKRGDVWPSGFGQWCLSGHSSDERMIVAAYGVSGPRPQFQETIFFTQGGGDCNVDNMRFLIFADLEFYPSYRDPNSPDFDPTRAGNGISTFAVVKALEDVLFENIKSRFGQINIEAIEIPSRRIALRRNIVLDNYATDSFAQGIYLNKNYGLLIEENLLDHNGWNENVAGAEASIFDHNVYIQTENRDVIVRGNMTANGGASGIQVRPGGLFTNNLMIDEPVPAFISGAGGEMSYNTVIGGADRPFGERSWGLADQSTGSMNIFRNMVINKRSGNAGSFGFEIRDFDYNDVDNNNGALLNGPKNLNFYENVVHSWEGTSMRINVSEQYTSAISVNNNSLSSLATGNVLERGIMHVFGDYSAGAFSFANNRYDGPSENSFHLNGFTSHAGWINRSNEMNSSFSAPTYTDPSRTVESYSSSLGLPASVDAFLAAARDQSKWNWDDRLLAPALNDYFREGFDVQNP